MSDSEAASIYTKDNPFPARLKEIRLLNKPGTKKETRHIVVNIAGSGLTYEAGDSIGVFPTNFSLEVEEIIGHIGASGAEPVMLPKAASPIAFREALLSNLSIASPTRKFLETLHAKATDSGQKTRLARLLEPEAKERMETYLDEREFVDLLDEYPSAKPTPQEFVTHLRRLVPRLYSIASSPRFCPEDVHLTVAVVRYHKNNRDRIGVCSTFMADRVVANSTPVPVFMSHSHFGPPEDGARDIIMVGPGTGIAPFRAFMQDRVATGAIGRNWLFFGEQHRATDYLYEEEWNEYLAKGQLTRLDLAFSRDNILKDYVQDHMRGNAAELWAWIKGGAYFYVCGDAKRMAKDVDAALHDVIIQQGGMEPQQAADYVKQMKKEKRYQRDVY